MSEEIIDADAEYDTDAPDALVTIEDAEQGQAIVVAGPRDTLTPVTDEEMANLERVVMMNDYKGLTIRERFYLLKRKADALGVDIMKNPYAWAPLGEGKMLVPVATKGLFQELRARDQITVRVVEQFFDPVLQIFCVRVLARSLKTGREDEDIGVVGCPPALKGSELANRMMVAYTKAKNRVTGSVAGGDASISQEEAAGVPKDRTPLPEMRDIHVPEASRLAPKRIPADTQPTPIVSHSAITVPDEPKVDVELTDPGTPTPTLRPKVADPVPENGKKKVSFPVAKLGGDTPPKKPSSVVAPPRNPSRAPVKARG